MSNEVLTTGDRAGECWLHLRKHYEARLATLRVRLEANQDERTTAKLRGQIGEVKHLLSLGTDKPSAPPEDTRPDI